MTIEEASRRYQVPLETLQEYERFGLCSSVKKIMGVSMTTKIWSA